MSPRFLFRIRAKHTHTRARSSCMGNEPSFVRPGSDVRMLRASSKRFGPHEDRAPGPAAAGQPSVPSGPPNIGSRGREESSSRVSSTHLSALPASAPQPLQHRCLEIARIRLSSIGTQRPLDMVKSLCRLLTAAVYLREAVISRPPSCIPCRLVKGFIGLSDSTLVAQRLTPR